MNQQLAKHIEICPSLSLSERSFVVARSSVKIQDMKESDMAFKLNEIILKAYHRCGQKADEKTVLLDIQELITHLRVDYKYLTIPEIELCFTLGIDEEFGEYFGLNLRSYRKWIKGFIKHEKRLEAFKMQSEFLTIQNQPKELTEDDKQEIIKKGAFNCFDVFKKCSQVIDYGNVTYNYLSEKGIISFTLERKKEITGKAKKIITDELNAKTKSCLDAIEAARIRQEINEIENKNDKVKVLAKKIALYEFFSDLIEMEQELKDLL